MPKLWTDTMDAHRGQLRDAVLEAAVALVAENGLRAVTMSEIAARAGIGRATLYKYYPDVGSMLLAWHEKHVAAHLEHLVTVGDEGGQPGSRLAAVLEAYALIVHRREQHGGEVSALLHRAEQVTQAEARVHEIVRQRLTAAAEAGVVRDDVPAGELATYCLHALGAASAVSTDTAVRRLVALTLAALRPPSVAEESTAPAQR